MITMMMMMMMMICWRMRMRRRTCVLVHVSAVLVLPSILQECSSPDSNYHRKYDILYNAISLNIIIITIISGGDPAVPEKSRANARDNISAPHQTDICSVF